MPQGAALQVKGYRELLRALTVADAKTKRELRAALRHTGEAVKTDSMGRVLTEHPDDQRTAAGYRVVVRQRGVEVEQALRRTSGLHPEWGAWQMRHGLVPALIANEPETARRMEAALDLIAARFNQGGPV